ncbi:MAG: helix-turn-helix domain-containing protein, partial [Pseudomonadota bacterium]
RTMSEGIASNILSDRLARLEAAGVISRQPDAQDGRRTRYLLTESGRDLIPVLLDIMAWSFRHDPSVNVSPAMAARIARDRDGLAAEIRAKLDGQ